MFSDFGSMELMLIVLVTLLVIGPSACLRLCELWVYGWGAYPVHSPR